MACTLAQEAVTKSNQCICPPADAPNQPAQCSTGPPASCDLGALLGIEQRIFRLTYGRRNFDAALSGELAALKATALDYRKRLAATYGPAAATAISHAGVQKCTGASRGRLRQAGLLAAPMITTPVDGQLDFFIGPVQGYGPFNLTDAVPAYCDLLLDPSALLLVLVILCALIMAALGAPAKQMAGAAS